ncbi:hypothetical protein [Halopseudomonas sabulinigri]|uniref:DUF4149 domain-containing protein n=1 Tax=Halopseudomonas sabulinigri TaxID=472181 RepID=A0ABP9ZMV0_9GAMM
MSPLQAAWLYYLAHPALVINALALFFAVTGSWLWLATQLRGLLAAQRLATAAQAPQLNANNRATMRSNRLFYSVGALSLSLALLLSVISTQI